MPRLYVSGPIRELSSRPFAGYEDEMVEQPAKKKMRSLSSVLAQQAACSTTASRRGHDVIFDKSDRIGGQFNMAKRIPGKKNSMKPCATLTIKWLDGVTLKLNTKADMDILSDFDAVVIATGAGAEKSRWRAAWAASSKNVLSYIDVLKHITQWARMSPSLVLEDWA